MPINYTNLDTLLSDINVDIEIPSALDKQKGRIILPEYSDVFLRNGYGLELETEPSHLLFDQLKEGSERVRKSLFSLCDNFGMICGPLYSPINLGVKLPRAQEETIWHVDRSKEEQEYYTLLNPDKSTKAGTWISPIAHFLSVAESELIHNASQELLNDILEAGNTAGEITDRITKIAEEVNHSINNGNVNLSRLIYEGSILAGGENGWLLFSDPLVIHTGNNPTGTDTHIMTFDLARKANGDYYSVY